MWKCTKKKASKIRYGNNMRVRITPTKGGKVDLLYLVFRSPQKGKSKVRGLVRIQDYIAFRHSRT